MMSVIGRFAWMRSRMWKVADLSFQLRPPQTSSFT